MEGTPGACPARKSEECGQIECAAKADFLLLLDGSGSMSDCDWKAQGWFAKEFVSRLPSAASQFTQAQVAVVQFSSDFQTDQELTKSRSSVLNVLDCDRCSKAGGTGSCSYVRKSGGTSTVIAMVEAISKLSVAPARDDAKKVIILMTDGQPTGSEGLPSGMLSYCQGRGLRVSSREDMVVCTSKFAQSKSYNTIPAKTCGTYDYMCNAHAALKGLDATIVTVGVNVNGYSGAKLADHFKEVASDPSLFLKIENINDGSVLDAMITDLLTKACPPIDCICKTNTPWGSCQADGTRTKKCIPVTLPDNGGSPCTSLTEPCGDCVWKWGPYSQCDLSTGTKTRSIVVVKQPVSGPACPTDDQVDICPVDCVFTWPAWSTCNVATGKQNRAPSITQQPKNGGTVCPPPDDKDCDIDCAFTWNEWSVCDVNTGKFYKNNFLTLFLEKNCNY